MAGEPEEKKEPQKPKSKKKAFLIILILAVVLLGGGGAGAYFFFFKQPPGDEKELKSQKEQPQVIQEMETFLVNLADPGGKRFLKVTLKAKLSSNETLEEFKTRGFELRDVVLTILSSKEVEDVARPEDKLTLKRDIMTMLNRNLRKGQVMDIYFTDFLIQ